MKPQTTSLTFLNEWVKDESLKCIEKNKIYTNPNIRKNFIDTLHVTPILRIFKFLKISNSYGITAILADSKHQILAHFPLLPTVTSFENKYRQRITYETTHCLILLRKVNLVFISKQELKDDYGLYFGDDIDVISLQVLDLDIFGRDKVVLGQGIERNLKFLYDDEDYKKVCRTGNANTFSYDKYCKSENIYKTL